MIRQVIVLIQLLIAILLTACGGSNANPYNCENFQGLATLEEISSTPRANAEAEILSLEASGKLVAPQNVYDRVVDELQLVRTSNNNLQNITAESDWYNNSLLIKFDDQGENTYKSG